VTVGVSPTLFYDPLERVVATLHANHTWEKIVFDPWRQETWDVNDTVLLDPREDPNAGGFVARLPEDEYLPTWYGERIDGALGRREQDAARKAARHAASPTIVYLDTLGRPFLTIVDNVEDKLATRTVLDIEGNQREIVDAKGRSAMRYDYDLLGHRIHQASMEAGERWMLNDVLEKAIFAWDSRDHTLRTTYDLLRRPVDVFLREGTSAEKQIGRTAYGEELLAPETNNLRGKAYQVFDTAGIATSERYDFKGNLLATRRQLAADYKQVPDWSASPALDSEAFVSSTAYDALNRPIQIVAPHVADARAAVVQPTYNQAALLEKLDVWPRYDGEPAQLLDGSQAELRAVTNIDYNANGQRTLIEYGNSVRTEYDYDPLTFRLVRLHTLRGEHALQDLRYTFDPSGNVTHLRDEAQQTIFFRNRVVEPSADYTYDALYRLIAATGREHLGEPGGAPEPLSTTDEPRVGLPHPSDGNAMDRYLQRYVYDEVGNILEMIHHGSNAAHGWRRAYHYDEPSQLEPGQVSNRLTDTRIGHTVESYAYDAHGNMTAMPHLPWMLWDFRDQLQAVTGQATGDDSAPETTYYVYDAAGQRVRKVTERAGRSQERIYIGSFEIYRKYEGDGSTIALERETLNIMDDKQRVALVETRTQGSDRSPTQLVRYQLGNHLNSAVLELDAEARVISYEEYYPYGSTSYQVVHSQTETPKRYRFTGKERDEESGLYYHGARYYAPWLGRWGSCDPAGMIDGTDLYVYTRNNPIRLADPSGRQSTPHPREEEAQASLPEVHGTSREEKLQVSLPEEHPELMNTIPASPPPAAEPQQPPPPPPEAGERRPSKEELRESVPLFSFFLRVPMQYVRPYQAPPQGAPVGLAAIRQLNGQPAVAAANFSRDYAPGTSVENLTSLTVQAFGATAGLLSAAQPLARAPISGAGLATLASEANASTLPTRGPYIRTPPPPPTFPPEPGQIIPGGRPSEYAAITLGGHGAEIAAEFKVPQGTYLQFPVTSGEELLNSAAIAIENAGRIPKSMGPPVQYGPGSIVPEHILYPPNWFVETEVGEYATTVTRPTLLSNMIEENMGLCIFTACRVRR
jgi:RHS repeat-associated protein